MKNANKMKPAEYEKVGRLLEEVVAAGYSKPSRLLWYSFIRGIAYGFGIFLAGTLVVGIVMWILGLFDQVPIIGRFIEHIINSINVQ